jgi:S-DNA-T family DNA segregation ATPase FtsK/SpoIIIE
MNTNELSDDEIYGQAIEYIKDREVCGVATIQRKFNLGYARASRILERMSDAGILGPYNGSQSRKVIK